MLNGRSDRRETWHIVVFFWAKYNFAIFDDVTRAQNARNARKSGARKMKFFKVWLVIPL